MYKTIKTKTKSFTLDHLAAKLKNKNAVDALLMIGSGANKTIKEYSDYDLVIVLNSHAKQGLFSAFTYIDNHIGDVYFFYNNKIQKLSKNELPIEASSMEGKLLSWLKAGNIIFDKTGVLTKLSNNKDILNFVRITESKKYSDWFGINFNYAHNLRMYYSKDSLYLRAVEIRLLYCLVELLMCYMELRDLQWKGEKEAIKYFKENNPEFLEKFFICIRTSDIHKKFSIYKELVQETLSSTGKVWDDTSAAVLFSKDLKPEWVQEGLDFWKALME